MKLQKGDTLNAQFVTAASADIDTRTITGTLVPYGEIGYTNIGPTIIAQGAIVVPEKVVYLKSHDHDSPAGRMIDHQDTATSLTGSFKIIATGLGDQLLLEASEGVRDGLSVGLEIDEWSFNEEDETITVLKATLKEVSQVTFPAFASAGVTKVAANKQEKDTEMDEIQIAEMVAAAVAKALPVVPETQLEAALPRIHTQDPFPYRPGVEASLFRDMYASNFHGNRDAQARSDVANLMLTAAADSTDLANIIPDVYRPELYVGQLAGSRPVIDSFSRGTLQNANQFHFPKFTSAAGLIADHVEGTNPTLAADDSIVIGNQNVTPKAVSGAFEGTRELFEGSTPNFDQIVLGAMREEYDKESEEYVAALFIAAATAGVAVPEATATAGVIGNLVAFNMARKPSARVMLAGDELFAALAVEIDTTGRPMNPHYSPVNASGVMDASMLLEVAGRPTPYAWSLTGGLIGVPSDAWSWESGMRTWRWEEKSGPARIQVAGFGYIAAAVMRAIGLRKFAVTPTA